MITLLLPLLCAASYYLGAHAKVTTPIWSRYPEWLDDYFLCAACSGFAYGAFWSFWFWWWGFPLFGYRDYFMIPLCAIGSIAWTPFFARILIDSLTSLPQKPKIKRKK